MKDSAQSSSFILHPPSLRILHLASSERWTGVAEPSTALAAAQRAAGHDVAFACTPGASFARRARAMGLPMVEGFSLDRGVASLRADVRRLRQYVLQSRPDVVHCHLTHDHWVAALALRAPFFKFRVPSSEFRRDEKDQKDPKDGATLMNYHPAPSTRHPTRNSELETRNSNHLFSSFILHPLIVRTLHRDKSIRSDLAHRWLAGKGCDAWIAVSQADQRALIERVGLPPPKVAWVRGSVDLERFRPGLPPEQVRDLAHVPREARVAGIVARMQPHRGHHLLLDTIEQVAQAVPRAHYLLAGRGEIKRRIDARIAAHPLRERLTRIGYRKNDLPETYAAMDVAVLLVPGSDGSCRAMLEAMACGRPVIGSRVGAIADTIEHGVCGWLVEPGDAEDLARALIEALGDPERTRRMGEAARRRAEERHSRQTQCAATIEVYHAAVARRNTKR